MPFHVHLQALAPLNAKRLRTSILFLGEKKFYTFSCINLEFINRLYNTTMLRHCHTFRPSPCSAIAAVLGSSQCPSVTLRVVSHRCYAVSVRVWAHPLLFILVPWRFVSQPCISLASPSLSGPFCCQALQFNSNL